MSRSEPESAVDGETLEEYLESARTSRLTGPAPSSTHLANAELFASAVPFGASVLDLGSGAGLPGLIVAHLRPDVHMTLLEASERRCRFLEEWVPRLAPTASVLHGRAETLARDERYRRRFETVVSRSFGPPAVTAECAAGFLAPGGLLLVSEPPTEDTDRWPVAGLLRLGLVAEDHFRGLESGIRLLRCVASIDAVPRADGEPRQRPMF